jgi:predicted ABC-type transport system involved in lysophospholipase L1 biosynthesis ATPase subunit
MVSHDSIVAARAQRTGLMENGRLTIGARPAHPIS